MILLEIIDEKFYVRKICVEKQQKESIMLRFKNYIVEHDVSSWTLSIPVKKDVTKHNVNMDKGDTRYVNRHYTSLQGVLEKIIDNETKSDENIVEVLSTLKALKKDINNWLNTLQINGRTPDEEVTQRRVIKKG